MSDFGSDLCPGEPCSVSLDHNFYASEGEEQPVVPFNTLDSNYSEEPLFLLDSDNAASGTPLSDESPSRSITLEDSLKSSSPEAEDQQSIEASVSQQPAGDLQLPNPAGDQQLPNPVGDQPLPTPGPFKGESSPPGLLHLYLTRKARRERVATPQVTTPVLQSCVLPQVQQEQLPATPGGFVGAAGSSLGNVCCCTSGVRDVSISYGASYRSNEEQGGASKCNVHEVSSTGVSGSSPFDYPTTSEQVSASGKGLAKHAGSVLRDLIDPRQKAQAGNSTSRSVQRAIFCSGEAVPQAPHCPQPVPTRESGWRCPRANKVSCKKRARQTLLDGWIVEDDSHRSVVPPEDQRKRSFVFR